MTEKKKEFNCKYHCLETCHQNESLYCIAEALINAQRGDLTNGFAFAGSNAYRCTKKACLNKDGSLISVKELMQRIYYEYHSAL